MWMGDFVCVGSCTLVCVRVRVRVCVQKSNPFRMRRVSYSSMWKWCEFVLIGCHGNRRHRANLHTDCVCCHKKVKARAPRKGKEERMWGGRERKCAWSKRPKQSGIDMCLPTVVWPLTPHSHCESPAAPNALKAGCCVRLIGMARFGLRCLICLDWSYVSWDHWTDLPRHLCYRVLNVLHKQAWHSLECIFSIHQNKNLSFPAIENRECFFFSGL